MYFMRGSLPWQGLPAKTKKEKYEKIRDKKLATTVKSLCKGHAEEFAQYMDYVRNLKFEDRPDAQLLRKLFKNLFYRLGHEYDFVFDWMVKKTSTGAAKATVKEDADGAEDVEGAEGIEGADVVEGAEGDEEHPQIEEEEEKDIKE
jgi:casein kinase 1